jgi:hypothetical protein
MAKQQATISELRNIDKNAQEMIRLYKTAQNELDVMSQINTLAKQTHKKAVNLLSKGAY